MSDIDINSLLAQMRATAAKLEQPARPDAIPGSDEGEGSFAAALKDSVDAVNATQQTAAAQAAAFEAGDPDVQLTDVMLELQKADLSFKAMTEVRNKLVNAYQEIMNMPV